MDRVTLEVIGSALLTIAEEMGTALIKSAYSTNIKERQDCSTAIFDAHGEVIAQAEHIPMHLGSLLGVVREILARYPLEALAQGDVFIANDPYTGGGTHLPDINLVSPVFAGGALFGFVANIAHHADRQRREDPHHLGRGPPDHADSPRRGRAHAGGRDGAAPRQLRPAARAPRRLPGADRRQPPGRAAARRADRRHGVATVQAACAESLAYGERKIRAAIAALPDGVYRYTDAMDDDGVTPEPIAIAVAITKRGDSLALDFSGSGPQCAGDINVVYFALLATVYYALKAALDPSIPANSGFYRAITVTAPEGSIVNARPPAPVAWRTQTCQRIADVVLGALAEVVPERVPAAGNGANCAMVFSGTDPKTGKLYVYLETLAGGAGATAVGDGMDAVQVHVTNTSNLPVESLESEYPLLVVEYALVDGSGGSGRHRGGWASGAPSRSSATRRASSARRSARGSPRGGSSAGDRAAGRASSSIRAGPASRSCRRRSGAIRFAPAIACRSTRPARAGTARRPDAGHQSATLTAGTRACGRPLPGACPA
jgi:N-methylhydantoinase B